MADIRQQLILCALRLFVDMSQAQTETQTFGSLDLGLGSLLGLI